VLGVGGAQFGLIEHRVQLDLVDRRDEECEVDDRRQVLGGEVGHPDRTGVAVLVGLHYAGPAVDVSAAFFGGPVNEVEVDIARPSRSRLALQASLDDMKP
jgi:hypothetical protein